MRPRGEIREVLARGLELGVGNTRELAMRTGVGVTAAMRTLDNMRRSGEVVVVREDPMPGVKRRVPVYGLAGISAAPSQASSTNWDLITCWAQWPVEA